MDDKKTFAKWLLFLPIMLVLTACARLIAIFASASGWLPYTNTQPDHQQDNRDPEH
jgi:hypothetical protein